MDFMVHLCVHLKQLFTAKDMCSIRVVMVPSSAPHKPRNLYRNVQEGNLQFKGFILSLIFLNLVEIGLHLFKLTSSFTQALPIIRCLTNNIPLISTKTVFFFKSMRNNLIKLLSANSNIPVQQVPKLSLIASKFIGAFLND